MTTVTFPPSAQQLAQTLDDVRTINQLMREKINEQATTIVTMTDRIVQLEALLAQRIGCDHASCGISESR